MKTENVGELLVWAYSQYCTVVESNNGCLYMQSRFSNGSKRYTDVHSHNAVSKEKEECSDGSTWTRGYILAENEISSDTNFLWRGEGEVLYCTVIKPTPNVCVCMLVLWEDTSEDVRRPGAF
jgi:hypothetical protein